MSINWVMLDKSGQGFVPLPREKILFTSLERTSLSITTPNKYPGKTPLNLSSSTGLAYVTNQRLVYLPTKSTPPLQSFSSPILNLMDTHVSAPFFGPNVWNGVLKPVTGGGIPAQHAYVEVKLVFKDGGAYDFHRIFEQVKDRLSQAVEAARDSGRTADLSNVPLEQLPAYEEAGSARSVVSQPQDDTPGPRILAPTPLRPGQQPHPPPPPPQLPSLLPPQQLSNSTLLHTEMAAPPPSHPASTTTTTTTTAAATSTNLTAAPTDPSTAPPPTAAPPTEHVAPPPDEPPPAYEEAQSSSVMNSVEESLRSEQA